MCKRKCKHPVLLQDIVFNATLWTHLEQNATVLHAEPLFFKVQWDGSDVAVVWGRIAKDRISLHPTLPWVGTEQHKTPTVPSRVLVSFLMGCCRNTVAQHARHLGGQPALSVDINSHLNTHTHKKKIPPELIHRSPKVSLSYFEAKTKTTKQNKSAWLLAR